MTKLNLKDDQNPSVPAGNAPATENLGGPGADLGYNGGTGADSGGTGAGTTALDAVGSDGNFDAGVADHLKVHHKLTPNK